MIRFNLFQKQSPVLKPEIYSAEEKPSFSLHDPHQILRNVIFGLSLCFALFNEPHLWLSRAAWLTLAVLFTIEPLYISLAIFFFAAFFMPSGIFPNSVFTLKHFHIVLALGCMVKIFKGELMPALESAKRMAKSLLPLFGILTIGLIPLFSGKPDWVAVKLTGNFALVLICLIVWKAFSGRDLFRIRLCSSFFVFGVCLQILNGLRHDIFLLDPFNYRILHNNHLAALAAVAAFHVLGLVLTTRNLRGRIVHWISLAIIFGGLVYSCSRTAWLGFGISFFILGYAALSNPRFHPSAHRTALVLLIGILMFAGVLIGQALMNQQVLHRLFELGQLMYRKTWEYTLNDTQNFGFLGIFRLTQLYVLWDILATHPVLGVGFTHQVIGFHGFYFTILGATGLLGLSLFAFYIRKTLHALGDGILASRDYEELILHISIFASLSAWLICSFMESLFLQYGFWVNMVLAASLLGFRKTRHEI